METIILSNEQSQFVHFQDQYDNSSVSQDSVNENNHSIFKKSSIDTKDSHDADSDFGSTEQVEESIMNWFGMKGILNGNPEDMIEKSRQSQRKNKRMDFSMSNLSLNKSSSLIQRRKNSSMN